MKQKKTIPKKKIGYSANRERVYSYGEVVMIPGAGMRKCTIAADENFSGMTTDETADILFRFLKSQITCPVFERLRKLIKEYEQ